ncbi:MAG: hypothetical protein QME88_02275 [Actinomycetota bacterium]|nr:hypothetical protein [Actinomycetota bacterium]
MRKESAKDWRAWPKKDLLRLREKNHDFSSRLQRDFGERIFFFFSFVGGIFGYTLGVLGWATWILPKCRSMRTARRASRRPGGR